MKEEREMMTFNVWEQGTGELTDGVEVEHESPRQAAFEAASSLKIGYREALLCVRTVGSESDPLVYRIEPRIWYIASESPIGASEDTSVTA